MLLWLQIQLTDFCCSIWSGTWRYIVDPVDRPSERYRNKIIINFSLY